jgi:flagellar biosynthesis/type III secretory pathway chaperone
MSTDPVALSALQALLRREIGHAAGFVEVLEREHAALAQRDMAVLARVIEEKRERVAELQLAGRERENLLVGSGFPPSAAGDEITREGAVPAAAAVLTPLWDQLQALSRKARRLSEVNAGIIELSRRHVERALAILHGKDAEVELYDPSARTSRASRSHPLAKV